jgi:hypothetical protein
MKQTERTTHTERLKNAAEARKALLAKLQPKPTVTAPEMQDRSALKAIELAQVRADRAEAKRLRREAIAEAEAAARASEEEIAAAALDAKRGERKERKALTKVEAKAKRDARYAARKARA